jgi:hypothetical protein
MTYYKYRNPSIVKEKGKINLNLVILFGLILLSVFYLVQINKIVAKNFELRASQDVLKEKQEKNQDLLVSLMQARSMSNLENAAKSLNLVAIEKINYLKAVSGFFALSQKP